MEIDMRTDPHELSTSAAGVELIKQFEGLRLQSYQDSVGVWTIGYGHTRTAGPNQRISADEAHRLLIQDIIDHEAHIKRLVKVPLSQGEFDALSSWVFNVGGGSLASSTLLRKLNAGDYAGAANEFPRWNKADGKVLAGLTRRRNAERDLWID
jgi:lysozyme